MLVDTPLLSYFFIARVFQLFIDLEKIEILDQCRTKNSNGWQSLFCNIQKSNKRRLIIDRFSIALTLETIKFRRLVILCSDSYQRMLDSSHLIFTLKSSQHSILKSTFKFLVLHSRMAQVQTFVLFVWKFGSGKVLISVLMNDNFIKHYILELAVTKKDKFYLVT